jgi:hypothetical protein
MNNEGTWKKAAVAYFKALYHDFPGGTEKNNEKLPQEWRSPDEYFNLVPPEYEAGVLTTLPPYSVEWVTKDVCGPIMKLTIHLLPG